MPNIGGDGMGFIQLLAMDCTNAVNDPGGLVQGAESATLWLESQATLDKTVPGFLDVTRFLSLDVTILFLQQLDDNYLY